MRDAFESQRDWPVDVEVMSAMAGKSSYPFMLLSLAVFVGLVFGVGPAEQHPASLWLVITLMLLSLLPFAVPVALGRLPYFFSPQARWLRALDFALAPLAVCAASATSRADVPVTMLYVFAFALMWPTQHPRNYFAASTLLWVPPVMRWWFVPEASLRSYAVLALVSIISFGLYWLSSWLLDGYRMTKRIVQERQQALEIATTAQHGLHLSMSVHDGLSGLAAVAEVRLKRSPDDQGGWMAIGSLRERIGVLLDGVEPRPGGIEALETLARSVGLAVTFDVTNLHQWDPISAGDLVEIVTELITNTARHGERGGGSIRIDASGAVISLSSPVAENRWAGGRGLRNAAQRIAAYGGAIDAKQIGSTFEVRAKIPNRRMAYAPPFLKVLAPSALGLLAAGSASAALMHWSFAWPHLAWYALVVVVHLTQLEQLSRKQRLAGERTEAALLTLQLDAQRTLIRDRLSSFRDRLVTQHAAVLIRVLADFRVELKAILFALEWQGTPEALEAELQAPFTGAAERVEHVHAAALSVFQRALESPSMRP